MRSAIPAVLLLSVAPSIASAGTVRPWLGAHVSPAMYRMSDVNDEIGSVNAFLAGSGLSMDEIHGGLGLGAAFGLELPGHLSVGIGYDRLLASSDVGDATGSITYDLPANAFRAFGQYSFAGAGASGGYLGGSLGRVTSTGSVTISITGSGSATGSLKGSGGLFELFAGGDWWAAPRFALTGLAGYRYAKISEIKMRGTTVYLANGEKESLDYGGVFGRAGFKFALTR